MEDKRKNQTSAPADCDLGLTPVDTSSVLLTPRLVLASTSPRRAEILRTVGWTFDTMAVEIDESRHAGENAATYVERLARAKAEAAGSRCSGLTIVGADTVVVIDDEILGKPQDKNDASRMLRLLNDRWHQVLTGVAVLDGDANRVHVSHETTEVKFGKMSADEIAWYVSTGEPMDKAGAYGIQGAGARFIEGIRGDYFNIVGLPVRLLYNLLNESRD